MLNSVYTPGAGTLPPVLAGRDALLRSLAVALNDVASVGRRRAQDVVLVGPRGVGKTVTLTTYGDMASATGFEVVNLQAVAGRSGLVESLLQRAESRIAGQAGAWTRARRAFERVAAVSAGVGGLTAGLTVHPRNEADAQVDPGTLAEALVALVTEIRRDTAHGGLLVTVDELQVASATDLALLAATLHRLNVDHPAAAVAFAGTGLPHTPEVLRAAGVTHPDRLLILEPLSLTLDPTDAAYAIIEPARRLGVTWESSAVQRVVAASNGYPAHLQQFAHTVWNTAAGPTLITETDVAAAMPVIAGELTRRTLGPRWDRMSDRQMEYLTALALLGGRAPSRVISATLGRTAQELSWIRQDLIREGDVYAPQRGHLSLAVPIFVPYILAHYEQARQSADIDLLSLDDMRVAASAAIAPDALPVVDPLL